MIERYRRLLAGEDVECSAEEHGLLPCPATVAEGDTFVIGPRGDLCLDCALQLEYEESRAGEEPARLDSGQAGD